MKYIGLKRHTVRQANHNDKWHDIAQSIIKEIKSACGKHIYNIEHIGSTAVKDIPAKPIIDIAIAVNSIDVMPFLIDVFTKLGYIYRGDGGDNGGHLFVMEVEPGIRTTHVHVVSVDDIQWNNYIKFRDILRNNPDTRNMYIELKKDLSKTFKDDRRAYTEGKNNFITNILKKNV
jgi:GrpB-like predicted nucleotidyltransferase (UPF0157 family)